MPNRTASSIPCGLVEESRAYRQALDVLRADDGIPGTELTDQESHAALAGTPSLIINLLKCFDSAVAPV
jgi:hypothetical protein